MIRITVDKIKTGQVLAQDVLRDDGVILMTKGRELSEDAISLLNRLEIEAVVVEGELFASEEEREAFLAEKLDSLDTRFSKVEGDPVLMALKEMFRSRIIKSVEPGGNG